MEREANYVAVGTFALLLIGMGVAFLIWRGDAGDSRDYSMYEIDFAGSVSGLEQGSAVRYLGVDVGRVRRLMLDRKRADQVKVIVEIDETAPITAATRASLSMQGITGLLFINLKQVPDGDASTPPAQGERYPVIPSFSSDFDVLLSSLPEMVARATTMIDHIDRVFNDQNIAAVAETLDNLRKTTQGLPKTAEKVSQLADQLGVTLNELHGAAASIRGIADDSRPQIQRTLQQLEHAAKDFSDATQEVNKFVSGAQGQMSHLSEHGLFELERLLRDARTAANEFRDLSRSLRQQPSQLMYERPNAGTEIRR